MGFFLKLCALLSSKPFIISSLNEIILLKTCPTPKVKEKGFPKKKFIDNNLIDKPFSEGL